MNESPSEGVHLTLHAEHVNHSSNDQITVVLVPDDRLPGNKAAYSYYACPIPGMNVVAAIRAPDRVRLLTERETADRAVHGSANATVAACLDALTVTVGTGQQVSPAVALSALAVRTPDLLRARTGQRIPPNGALLSIPSMTCVNVLPLPDDPDQVKAAARQFAHTAVHDYLDSPDLFRLSPHSYWWKPDGHVTQLTEAPPEGRVTLVLPSELTPTQMEHAP